MTSLPSRTIHEPLSIRAEGSNHYRVAFASEGGEVDYIFEVGEGAIPVLTWEPNFRDNMGGLLDSATSLFESIQAFHLARKQMT